MQLQVAVYNTENKYSNKIISSFEEKDNFISNKELIKVAVNGDICGIEVSSIDGKILFNEKLNSIVHMTSFTFPQFQSNSIQFKK